MIRTARPVGDHLREWRQRRRLSQLDLALEAEISTRHLSFLETGRSTPSREMVLHLAEQLDIPLRERNVLLNAAGYAPVFLERPISDPALQAAYQAVDLVLKGHEPYPALAVDRHWNSVATNSAVAPLMAGADPALLQGQINVLRLSLHPKGIASRIANLPEWRAHLLARLRRQIELTADPDLAELMQELLDYPVPHEDRAAKREPDGEHGSVVVPFQLITENGILSFFSTTTVFGTPVDITLSELALECFYPTDQATTEALLRLGEERRRESSGSAP
ncbi:transcriptional regulator, XRE family [Rhizobiales bacterium GAS191]|jgi:transcriptional regulator with XRE-family HTH domain|nr:transcriptional regulator, XRE family [Rhizobiales bacterium GAS113]SEC47536.1 transcriptional regulator, XRE family [Rhizobiales bacterium GAS191]SEC78820.1 transcriptional regulator, XRE family [Rhizobiales bacterium GAS188]